MLPFLSQKTDYLCLEPKVIIFSSKSSSYFPYSFPLSAIGSEAYLNADKQWTKEKGKVVWYQTW